MTEARPTQPPAPPRKNYDVEAKLIDVAYARKPASLLMTAVVSVLGVGLLWRHVSTAPLLGWLVAVMGATALGYAMCAWFKRAVASGKRPARAQVIFTAQAILAGAAWGLGPVLFLRNGMGAMSVALVGTLLCVCAVAMTSIAGQKNAMQGFILAALVPPAVSNASTI